MGQQNGRLRWLVIVGRQQRAPATLVGRLLAAALGRTEAPNPLLPGPSTAPVGIVGALAYLLQ
jgi:hypothetical protein